MSDDATRTSDSYFETVEVGETDRTEARTITEADVVNFAGVSGDFNHLHMDAERMEDSQFGQRIAHGTLVFSVATGLLWQSRSEAERESLVAFYGVDDLRFVGPVVFGDTIHVETEVVEKREKPEHPVAAGVLHTAAEIKKQNDAPVITCEFLSLMQ
ncbi:MaoC/PaaZ C-terminal domain-containing protein [Halorientalis brevis]|uniref:MaoC/PaaZ C-terminal domain-containing protein n=1 Tax=Halorientalis brevis TaxID=1126241 RepID=A0ABD6CBA6_9EURY|nr:MaoC/PaaZ C-terminal domain-containing protein [Halorientalis brevis]